MHKWLPFCFLWICSTWADVLYSFPCSPVLSQTVFLSLLVVYCQLLGLAQLFYAGQAFYFWWLDMSQALTLQTFSTSRWTSIHNTAPCIHHLHHLSTFLAFVCSRNLLPRCLSWIATRSLGAGISIFFGICFVCRGISQFLAAVSRLVWPPYKVGHQSSQRQQIRISSAN